MNEKTNPQNGRINGRKRLLALISALLALLLLSSCASTYTAVLYGGGGGNVGLPGLPGVGGSQGGGSQGGGGGSQERDPLPSDHLFYEPSLDTDYEGCAEQGDGFVVNFSSGLSQASGKGRYLFERQILTEDALSAIKNEISGKNPYLTVGGKKSYALYALEGHENLKRVAISYLLRGVRRLDVFEYTAGTKEQLEEMFKGSEPAVRYSPQWVQWLVGEGKLAGKKESVTADLCKSESNKTSHFWISPIRDGQASVSGTPEFYALGFHFSDMSEARLELLLDDVASYKVAFLREDGQEEYAVRTPASHLHHQTQKVDSRIYLIFDEYDELFFVKGDQTGFYKTVIMALDEEDELLAYGETRVSFTSYAQELRRQAMLAGVLKPTAEPERHVPDWFEWLLTGGCGIAPLASGDTATATYWHTGGGSPSAFTISHFDLLTGKPDGGGESVFSVVVPVKEQELRELAGKSGTAFALAYRRSGSSDPFTVEQSRLVQSQQNDLFLSLKNGEGVLDRTNGRTQGYEFVVLAYDEKTGEALFYKRLYTDWTDSSGAYFAKARAQGLF